MALIRPDQIQVDQSSPLGRGRTRSKNVYRATMGTDLVAIKVLSQDAQPTSLISRSSLWESLHHPNVLRVFGVSPEDADPLFIVSELHESGDVRGYLDENPNADRPMLALDVALGMQFLHSHNIIHGSLKTSDILVKEDGHACVADYGVVEIQSSKNPENHRYFSPEAWKGTTSKPSDVFAFAMSAFEIFTSQPPFGILSEKHIYRSVVEDPPSRPDKPPHGICVRVGLTDAIWGIIEESWDREPRLRPSFDIIVRMWGGGVSFGGGTGGAAVVYAPNPAVHARSDSIRSVSSGPPAYESEPKPPLPPIMSDVTGESESAGSASTSTSPIQPAPPALPPLHTQSAPGPPIRAMSLNSIHSDSTSPPPSFSAAAGGSAPDFGSVFGQNEKGGGIPRFQVDNASSPSAASSSSGPSLSRQQTTSPPPLPVSSMSPGSSPSANATQFQYATYTGGSNPNSNLPSPALSESFSRPVQPLRVPARPPMVPNPTPGLGLAGSRVSTLSGYSASVSDRESISSSGSGYGSSYGGGGGRHPSTLMPRRRRTLIIQNANRGGSEPPSAPSSIDSFGQRTANPHRIVEEDESAHLYGNPAIPPPSHTSGSGSGSTSRNGSRVNLAGNPGAVGMSMGSNPNLSAETQARLATLSHAHSLSHSQSPPPGGGGGYAPSIAGMSDVGSFNARSMNTVMTNPVLLVGAIQAEVKAGRKDDLIDDYLIKAYHLALQSDKAAQKLITAGLVPTLIHLLKTRAASGDGEGVGLDLCLMALGALAHDTISSNTIFRTNTTTTLIELFTSSYSDEISALSIWCLTRICRSAEIAQGLIKAGLVKHLLMRGLRGGEGAARLSAWCIGALVHTDAIADILADMAVIPDLVDHLKNSSSSPTPQTDDVCSALFAVARMARSIKLSKILAKAGCIEPLAHHLNTSSDPMILDFTARAVGCLMRPNSSDMSRLLLDAGVAGGLARMPSVLSSNQVPPLASFAFAIQRFSCAEWGGGTRKALVEAGVVDSLLAALRTAADEPFPQVHIELALAVSFLGDVGGKDIRKEIVSAGGIKILKKVGAVGSAEVSKACGMAVTSITGNIWTRNAASAKTAMTHNWSGGCPEYHPPCPVLIEEEEEFGVDRLGDSFSEAVGIID